MSLKCFLEVSVVWNSSSTTPALIFSTGILSSIFSKPYILMISSYRSADLVMSFLYDGGVTEILFSPLFFICIFKLFNIFPTVSNSISLPTNLFNLLISKETSLEV